LEEFGRIEKRDKATKTRVSRCMGKSPHGDVSRQRVVMESSHSDTLSIQQIVSEPSHSDTVSIQQIVSELLTAIQ
jgi:hypothetical protein